MKKKSLREIYDALKERKDRIATMAETLKKEDREMTDAEKAEYQKITREVQVLEMERYNESIAVINTRENDGMAEAEKMVRENLQAGKRTEFLLTRDIVNVATVTAGGIVPLRIQDIIKPLSEGLILDKVGLPFRTGLSGEFVWPMYEAVEAQVAGENVALTDKVIPMSKLTASPERIGITVPVSRQAIVQSEGIVEQIVRTEIPMSVTRLLNKIMFSLDKVPGAVNLKGPYVDKKSGAAAFAANEPTFKELNMMKADILKTGITGENMCYVMTRSMKAILEGTPKDAGSGIMVCENDMIAGLPVFCTNYIGEGYVGLGDWRYQPMGLFGPISFIVDPYSSSKKDQINFTLNTLYATKTLRAEAFVLKKGKNIV